jgi:hypothetical protein
VIGSAESAGSSAVEVLEPVTNAPGESGRDEDSGSVSVASVVGGCTVATWAISMGTWAIEKGAAAKSASAMTRMTDRRTRGSCEEISENTLAKRNTSSTSRFANAFKAGESGCALSI